jgi:lambda family phage tail tape measure protein
MSLIARLGVILGLNSAEFTKGLDDATKKTKDFERNTKKALKDAEKANSELMSNLGKTAIAVSAIGYATLQAFQYADEIQKTADAFEVTIESLISIQGALQASGNQAANAETMFSKLAMSQQNARDGSDELRESFKKLDISGKDVDNLSLDDMFRRVAVELSKVQDATQRAALAQELLGKAAKGTDWKSFLATYKEFSDPALADAIRENAKAWDNIEQAMKASYELVQKMIAPFAILVNSAFDILKMWREIKAGADVDIDWGAAMGGAPGDPDAITSHKGTGKTAQLDIAKKDAIGGYSQKSAKEIAAAKKAADEAVKKQKELDDAWAKLLEKQIKYQAVMDEIKRNHDQMLVSYWEEFYLTKDELALEAERYRITDDNYKTEKLKLNERKQMIEIEKKFSQQQLQALTIFQQAKSEDVMSEKRIYEAKIKNIMEAKEIEINSIKEIQEIKQNQLQEEIDRQYSWQQGWHEAFRNYTEDSSKAARYGAEAFNTVVSTMESALEKFVRTGKLNFKDLIGSMIKDLIVLQMKAQATKLFTQLLGSVGLGSTGGSGANVANFATGGNINGPSIVGENGPELFVPRQSGTIIPNGAWQSQMSGQGQTVINGPYIARVDAIDAKTFEQYVMGSNKAVWAANQYAQKSLALGAGRT